MRTDLDINYFKEKLETEKKLIEGELSHVGKSHQLNGGTIDWEGKPADFDTDSADSSETADKIEEYEENTAVVKNLEIRYNEIVRALKRVEDRTYGYCNVCKAEIGKDRLEANQAAETCQLHMN